MRYDPEAEVFRDCKWCHGEGCLQCKNEADKAYKETSPDGPVLIAKFDTTTPDGVAAAKDFIHDMLNPHENNGSSSFKEADLGLC